MAPIRKYDSYNFGISLSGQSLNLMFSFFFCEYVCIISASKWQAILWLQLLGKVLMVGSASY